MKTGVSANGLNGTGFINPESNFRSGDCVNKLLSMNTAGISVIGVVHSAVI